MARVLTGTHTRTLSGITCRTRCTEIEHGYSMYGSRRKGGENHPLKSTLPPKGSNHAGAVDICWPNRAKKRRAAHSHEGRNSLEFLYQEAPLGLQASGDQKLRQKVPRVTGKNCNSPPRGPSPY